MPPNAPEISPQLPRNNETHFYEAQDWSFTDALIDTGTVFEAGPETGGDSASAMFPYLSAGSGPLPYPDADYASMYPSPIPINYQGSYGSGGYRALLGEAISGGSSSGWGGVQIETLIKSEGNEGLEVPKVDQSRVSAAGPAPVPTADDRAIEYGHDKVGVGSSINSPFVLLSDHGLFRELYPATFLRLILRNLTQVE